MAEEALIIGDTVTMEGHTGFYVHRVSDDRVSVLYKIMDVTKWRLLTYYDKLIRCRTVLTEKTIRWL